MKILEEELRITMALAGYVYISTPPDYDSHTSDLPNRCASLAEISRHHLSVVGPNGMLCKL